jgi:ATP-dependent protease ClpP protease subunit
MFKFIAFIAITVAGLAADARDIVLNMDNTVTFRGVVNAGSVDSAMEKLEELDSKRGAKNYPLYLVLDSPGGSISAGLEFIEYAKSIKNLKTISIYAASMASAIVEALPGERLVLASGVLMFHRAKGGFEGQFEDGEVEAQLAFAKQIVRHMELTNAKRMSMSLKSYKEAVRNEYWLFGSQAVSKKAADQVVSITCTKDLISAKISSTQMSFFGPVATEYSRCPLFKKPIIKEEPLPEKGE